jgi:transcriptional regulator with XRE-family HTH domain
MSEIERGNKWPQPDNLSKIAHALKVEVYNLFKPENATAHEVNAIVSRLETEMTGLLNHSVELLNQIVRHSEK